VPGPSRLVVFEVDEFDRLSLCTWTVTLSGRCALVSDLAEKAGITSLQADSSAPTGRDHYLRLTPKMVTGHRTH